MHLYSLRYRRLDRPARDRQPQRGPAAEVIWRAADIQNLSIGTLCGAAGFGVQARSVIYAAWRQEYSEESRASVEGRSFPVMEPITSMGTRVFPGWQPHFF